MFDSLAVDANGDVCVATLMDGGITTLCAADGEPSFVPMPDRVTTNICFGGPDLKTAFITLSSTGLLVKLRLARGGTAPLTSSTIDHDLRLVLLEFACRDLCQTPMEYWRLLT